MRLLLFMFVTHNWGYSLNDFISIISSIPLSFAEHILPFLHPPH